MYVTPRNHVTDSRMEALLSKLVKGLKNQDSFLKEIMENILGLSQKVELHATATKQLQQKFSQIYSYIESALAEHSFEKHYAKSKER